METNIKKIEIKFIFDIISTGISNTFLKAASKKNKIKNHGKEIVFFPFFLKKSIIKTKNTGKKVTLIILKKIE